MTTIERLPDGGVEVTFDSEEMYILKVEKYRKRTWDLEGFRTFLQYKGGSDRQLAKRVGMRESVLVQHRNQAELNHRKNMLNLIVRRPLMETYLWNIAKERHK